MLLTPSRKKKHQVQGFVLKIVNHNCADVQALIEGPRLEKRVNLTVAVQVVPFVNRRPVVHQAFATVTREFSTSGVSLVLNQPCTFEQSLVGFSWEGEMNFVRAEFRHQEPLGAGLWALGLELAEVVHRSQWPELAELKI